MTSFADRRDRARFAAAYADPASGITTGPRPPSPVCTGPLAYTGQQAIAADIANFKTALAAAGVAEGFMTAVAPGSAYRIPNTYYKSDEEFLYAWAEALREEYRAILDAGLAGPVRLDQRVGARQAPGMAGQDMVAARSHAFLPQSWRLANAAPRASVSSLAQAMSGWMRPPSP